MAKKEEKTVKRTKVSQTEFPRESLAKALSIAEAIWQNFAGKGAAPYDIALALDLSPTSGGWRNLCGTSIAYGLTQGGYNAKEIELTDLGRRIVAPELEGDDKKSRVEAILQPRVMGEFLKKYDKAMFPKNNIAGNVLISLGVPKDRAEKSVELIRENGIFAGILKETKTGLFVALGSPAPQPTIDEEEITGEKDEAGDGELEEIAKRISGTGNSTDVPDNPYGTKQPSFYQPWKK